MEVGLGFACSYKRSAILAKSRDEFALITAIINGHRRCWKNEPLI